MPPIPRFPLCFNRCFFPTTRTTNSITTTTPTNSPPTTAPPTAVLLTPPSEPSVEPLLVECILEPAANEGAELLVVLVEEVVEPESGLPGGGGGSVLTPVLCVDALHGLRE